MAHSRSTQVRRVSGVLQVLAVVGIVIGICVGWLLPHMAGPVTAPLRETVAAAHVETTTFLGSALTTLGVIVAILIGYNVAGLQTAGQLLSLALARAMLLSLAPFLLWWTVTTGVGLVYLLAPPVYMGQLWQILVWFAAVVLFMLSYLWALPWRLSGDYAAHWAVDDLTGTPIEDWESQDGYDVLQSSMASATSRGDLGVVRAITSTLGAFLVTASDPTAEEQNTYHRARFRALKNLVSGCAQFTGAAPTAVSYQLGFITAGALLRSIAIGLPIGEHDASLFSGILRPISESPERHESLWTGMRHALCRGDASTAPYLLRYWRHYPQWEVDDPRTTVAVADGLMRLHAEMMVNFERLNDTNEVGGEAAHLLEDFYTYIAGYLRLRIMKEQADPDRARLLKLAEQLLLHLHERALVASETWGEDERGRLITAYEQQQDRFAVL